MREAVVENEFVKAVRNAGGVAYKLTSQTTNGLPDRLVLFFPAKTVFVELKAPGKVLRPLQRKRRYQFRSWASRSCALTGSPRSNLQSRRSWTGYPVNPSRKESERRSLNWMCLRWLSYREARRLWPTLMIMAKPWNP